MPVRSAHVKGPAVDELSLNPKFLQNLILRARALMAQERHVSDDEGNYSDDRGPAALQANRDNLMDDEVIGEIDDLEPDQQAELVALFWIGRGDLEPEEWTDAMQLAMERQQGSTAVYLLSHPHIADHWCEGLDKIFDGSSLVETGEY